MPSIDQVKVYLAERGVDVLEFDTPTPDAPSAAAAIGCSVAEIAKSILLIVGGKPIMVVTSGDMKVNSSLLKKVTGITGKVKLPYSDEVAEHTGYRPGGVCPFLLPEELPVYIDRSLERFDTIYPSAGNDHSGVPITNSKLIRLTSGSQVEVSLPLPTVAV